MRKIRFIIVGVIFIVFPIVILVLVATHRMTEHFGPVPLLRKYRV
jgi:NADH:ubiquinone oxidoreductase subunit 3 (subunit A)